MSLTAAYARGTATGTARQDDEDAQQDVPSSRQPESVPVQRRVTVVVLSGIIGELVVCRIDPHVSCTHETRFSSVT